RFNEYVRMETTADPAVPAKPSSAGQQALLERLAAELRGFGLAPDLRTGLLLARIPASQGLEHAPAVGFVAHVDTSPEVSGEGVRPVVHGAYNGRDIRFPDDPTLVLRASEHPALAAKIGHDIVTASGATLLGADDKAGVAIVMTLAEHLARGAEPHGPVSVAFTTDEEVGRGADGFDIEAFGAVAAYTLDGGEVGELEAENFNADGVTVTFTGFNTHPGYAKDKLANALRALGHFLASLPPELSPERTSDRDGFVHPHTVQGGVERASVQLILRDFDLDALDRHGALVERLAREAAARVPGIAVDVARAEQYRNMRDALARHPEVVTYAEDAIRAAGLEVTRKPIRGGTDGAKLSAMGLPTPNLFSGQHNIHSRLEWVSIQDMEKAVDVCIHICRIWAASQLPAARV
ncbi:MAG TPA: peptidase T, partial [Vicinamibacterales bacterium]